MAAAAALVAPGRSGALKSWRLNRRHPLAHKLRFFIVCNGAMAIDLVTGRIGAPSGTILPATAAKAGRMAAIDSNDYFDFGHREFWSLTEDISLVFRGVIDSAPGGLTSRGLITKSAVDAGYNSPFLFDYVTFLRFIRTSAGDFRTMTGPSVTLGAVQTMGLSSAADPTTVKFYVDAAETAGTPQFGGLSGAGTDSAQPLYVGRGRYTSNPIQLDGKVAFGLGWARRLSLYEHRQIHALLQMLQAANDEWLWKATTGALVQAAGLAIETDSAFGITWSKRRAVGLAAETDSALAAVARRVRAVGQPAETDSAFAVARAKLRAVGLAAETDSAPAATPRRTRAVGLPNETDSALAVARRKTMAAGLATETDTAPSVSSGTGHPIGQVTETDTAFAVTRIKLRLVGLATETDSPLAIVVLKRRAIGLATETDAAPAAAHVRGRTVGLAVETDTAPAVGRGKSKAVGLAVETDSVLAFVIVSDVPAREQVLAAIAAELATITGIAGLTVARARTTDVLETELPILVLFDDDERLSFEMTGERKAVLTIRVEGFASGATALAAQQAAGTLRAALDRLLADPDVMFSPSGKTIRALRQLPEGRPARLRLAGGDPAAAFVRRIDVEYATPSADPYTLI